MAEPKKKKLKSNKLAKAIKPVMQKTIQKAAEKFVEPITVAEMLGAIEEVIETPRQKKNRLYSELGRLSGLRMLKIVENEDIKEIDKEIANKKTEIESVIQATATLRS